ncbi:hypothetical protein [Paraburkholderia susongensis]|uniref:Phage protein, HK97 gp10 family n=1 Tax=Paraburkholderia susongensis TaxID=1515439 RepID=A0A1X7I4Y6_9BURK|nr:hypothetical protein [Paraburkholderia susongensis]SMG09515.1 hypothetical protein SAMN06265784_101326 [Paraburkholderia susongensis]
MSQDFDVNVPYQLQLEGWSGLDRKLDFDRKQIRAGMRDVGKLLQKATQQRVSGGDTRYPVRRTGRLRRNIRYKIGRSGFWVKVRPEKGSDMPDFYPAFLYYGVRYKAGGRYRRGANFRNGTWRTAPLGNYPADTLNADGPRVKQILEAAFSRAFR